MTQAATELMIEARALTRFFDQRPVVNQLSFAVNRGEIYGLIGPNGAGKTTTMRMLCGLLGPSGGGARIAGHDVQEAPLLAKAQLGFLSAATGLYDRLTVREQLRYYGTLYGMSAAMLRERTQLLAQRLDVVDLLDRRCGKLSAGQRQRVALMRATLHDPPVLILDEPTARLDVLASGFVAEFMREAKREGRAILFSTHYMTEAELLCDRIGLLLDGSLLAEGTAAALKSSYQAATLEQLFIEQASRRTSRELLPSTEVTE